MARRCEERFPVTGFQKIKQASTYWAASFRYPYSSSTSLRSKVTNIRAKHENKAHFKFTQYILVVALFLQAILT